MDVAYAGMLAVVLFAKAHVAQANLTTLLT